MAKPTREAGWPKEPLAAAVSMPTTCPAEFTSGPPESPGWMGASVWINPVRCSEPPRSSATLIERPRPEIVPSVTLGVPPCPSALPIATTSWPTLRFEESASVTVGSPDTPWI